jgi:hypothetical protein
MQIPIRFYPWPFDYSGPVALLLSKIEIISMISSSLTQICSSTLPPLSSKSGKVSLPSNYRPVSLSSCVSKIFEKIVFKNILNHLHKNKLLYKFQSGFIPGLSTTHQLLEIYHTIF